MIDYLLMRKEPYNFRSICSDTDIEFVSDWKMDEYT